MGSCVSLSNSPASAAVEFGEVVATAKVMDLDGSMAQFAAPVMAREALGDERRRASCFVCSSDELYFDAPAPALAAEEALQAGQLYFVLPLSMLRRPLSGQDMAAFAVKASTALAVDDADRTAAASSSQRKNGGNKQPRQTARVVPLAVVSSNEGEPDGEWHYHVYGKYGTRKTVYGDRTVGKTVKGDGYRSGARRRAGVQRLSAAAYSKAKPAARLRTPAFQAPFVAVGAAGIFRCPFFGGFVRKLD